MDTYKVSIFGGMVCGILPNLPMEDILVTVYMALFGTLSSFVATVFLKWIDQKMRQ